MLCYAEGNGDHCPSTALALGADQSVTTVKGHIQCGHAACVDRYGILDAQADLYMILFSRHIVEGAYGVGTASDTIASVSVAGGDRHAKSSVGNGDQRRAVIGGPIGGLVKIQVVIGEGIVSLPICLCIREIEIQIIVLLRQGLLRPDVEIVNGEGRCLPGGGFDIGENRVYQTQPIEAQIFRRIQGEGQDGIALSNHICYLEALFITGIISACICGRI